MCQCTFQDGNFTGLASEGVNVHRNHKVYEGRGEGGRGRGFAGRGEREITYLSLYCHH